MAYSVEVAEAAEADLAAILAFLYDAHRDFGEDAAAAFDRAAARLRAIDAAISALGQAPHQGTLRPELGPGIRHATKDRAILYFEVDDGAARVRVLAIFFGGQNHREAIRRRLGAPP